MIKITHIVFTLIIVLLFRNSVNMNMLMISEIIKNFKEPSVITGFICGKNEYSSFVNSLAGDSFMSRALNMSENKFAFNYNNHDVYVLDLKCKNSNKILEMANKLKLFASPNRWIITNDVEDNLTSSIDIITYYFSKVNIMVDSDVIFVNNALESRYTVQKIYKTDFGQPIIFEDYGIWEEDIGYKILEKNVITADRRRNLMGATLKACLVITHNDSLSHLLDKRDKHIDSIAKVNYVFMLHLSDLLNATMTYSIEPTWGYKNNKSEWSGMIGELTTQKADIGGTPLFLTSDRVSIIDYIAMTTPTKSKFVFRQPKLSYITNVFTLPFATTVWISSCAFVSIAAIGLYFVVKWEWHKKEMIVVESTEPELEPSFIAVLFLAFGAVCQQGAAAIPYTVSGRIITILLFISLMFLYTSYSANIVALLQSSSTSIQTLSDLLHSRLQVGVDDTVFNHFYFPNATEPIRKAIYLQKVAPAGQRPRFFPIEEGVRKMRQGLFAFHMETGAGYKLVGETFFEDEKCGLQEIQYLQVPDPWLAIQKNSSYKEILKIGLRKIHESGIQPREVSLLYTKKPDCLSGGSSFVGVSSVDCYPATMVFLIGIMIAVVIFFLEILFYYRLRLYHFVTKKLLP